MSATTASLEIRVYLDAVRAHLSDLRERDLEELLEDLEQHLLEVAAEGEGTLEDRLGPPAVYAEELRASAGLPGPVEGRTLSTRALVRLQRSPLGRAFDSVAESKPAGALRAFLPEMRPGWWVFRGYLAVAAPDFISSRDNGFHIPPRLFGTPALGLAATIAAIWGSVALGRRSETQRSARRMSILANIAIVLAALAATSHLSNLSSNAYAQSYEPSPSYLHHADGSPIANICPYASDGTPLTGVLLFDQEGRPIIDLASQTADGRPVGETQPAIRNAYPHTLIAPDPATGDPQALSCPIIPKQASKAPAATPAVSPAPPGTK